MGGKVIVLTGGNKGIGYEIALLLLETTKEPVTLYLTARQPALGQAAVEKIKATGLPTKSKSELLFCQLDINSDSSVDALAAYLKQQHEHIHVLINNAGVLPRDTPYAEAVNIAVECNYYGTARVSAALLPLLHPTEGRIVNVSSMAGSLDKVKSKALQEEFANPSLTKGQLDELMERWKKEAVEGTAVANGWPESAYGGSKVGMTALTFVTAREHPGLLINAISPGWVKTDMAPDGPGEASSGAKTPTFVAIGDIKGATGKFFDKEQNVVDWMQK